MSLFSPDSTSNVGLVTGVGGEVKVRIKDNQPVFEIVSAPPKAVKPKGTKGEVEGCGEGEAGG